MSELKKFAVAAALGAMGTMGAGSAFADPPSAPEPEQEQTQKQECKTFDETALTLREKFGEVLINTASYDGNDYKKGEYKLYADPQTGSWSLFLDPDVNPADKENPGQRVCEDNDHAVFQMAGEDGNFPDSVQFLRWYDVVFGGPKFL